MPDASVFEIEELTGSQRRVVLRGRAMPYQGVEFGGEQRVKTTWYPGNPVATLQVLGPSFEPTEMNGTWKERFLPNQVELRGIPDVDPASLTAMQLVAIFEDIRKSGNDLRVQFGPNVRFGILRSFVPRWIRTQDIEWAATFEWIGEERTSPRAGITSDEVPQVRAAQQTFDGVWTGDPSYTLPAYRITLIGSVNNLRRGVGFVFDGVRQATTGVALPFQAVQAVLSAAVLVGFEVDFLLSNLADLAWPVAQTRNGLVSVLRMECWRRTTAFQAARVRAAVIRQARALAKTSSPGAVAVVVMPENGSLRQIALMYYGSADEWQKIADINGFDRSVVPAGTVVIVPPAAGA